MFRYENKLTYTVYLSNQKFKDCMDLLLISDECKSYYVYIKDFDRFMFNKTKNKNKKYFCKCCLQCFSFNKLFDVADHKVRDHCYVTGKYRGAAHWSCNVNRKMSKEVPVIFHNLEGYDSHLTTKEVSNFNVKISVIPNRLEKYMAFTINKNLVFIDSMQFMKTSLDSLVKNLLDKDFKYSSEKFSGELLILTKEKGVYLYEYTDSFKTFSEDKLPDKCRFFSSLKDKCIMKQNMRELSIFGMFLK